MKFRITVPAAAAGLLAAIGFFAVGIILDERLSPAVTAALCGVGGILMGLCGTALGLTWVDKKLTPEQRREIERGEKDERNMAIREKAAYSSWYWSLYLLWALWFLTLVTQGGMYSAFVSVTIVLYCGFYAVNMRRWSKKL